MQHIRNTFQISNKDNSIKTSQIFKQKIAFVHSKTTFCCCCDKRHHAILLDGKVEFRKSIHIKFGSIVLYAREMFHFSFRPTGARGHESCVRDELCRYEWWTRVLPGLFCDDSFGPWLVPEADGIARVRPLANAAFKTNCSNCLRHYLRCNFPIYRTHFCSPREYWSNLIGIERNSVCTPDWIAWPSCTMSPSSMRTQWAQQNQSKSFFDAWSYTVCIAGDLFEKWRPHPMGRAWHKAKSSQEARSDKKIRQSKSNIYSLSAHHHQSSSTVFFFTFMIDFDSGVYTCSLFTDSYSW